MYLHTRAGSGSDVKRTGLASSRTGSEKELGMTSGHPLCLRACAILLHVSLRFVSVYFTDTPLPRRNRRFPITNWASVPPVMFSISSYTSTWESVSFASISVKVFRGSGSWDISDQDWAMLEWCLDYLNPTREERTVDKTFYYWEFISSSQVVRDSFGLVMIHGIWK